MVVVNCWDKFCTLGRAPLTKETLPDFREWCRVTRHPRVFRRLTGCQRTPEKWGVTSGLWVPSFLPFSFGGFSCKNCCLIVIDLLLFCWLNWLLNLFW